MAFIRCDAGLHFYDSDKNSTCPFCRIQGSNTAGALADDATVAMDTSFVQPSMDYDGDETVSVGLGESVGAGGDQYVTVAGGLDPDAPTVGSFRKKTYFSPVVGWLVCVDGAGRGKDYRIKPGINLIGRDNSSDIVVDNGDDTISRKEHAELEYDPEDNAFFLIRKRNPEVRLNGTKIREPKRIAAYDVLQFGETAFLFIPMCSENFQWSVQE